MEDTITELQERYTVAYLLGIYFARNNIEKDFFAECVEVRIPQTSTEFYANIFAAFLLLQPDKFFKEVDKYINKTGKPINQEALLLEMSKWARVPYLFTITSYECLKIIAAFYYNKAFKDKLIGEFDGEHREMIEEIWKENKLLPDEFFY